MWRNSVVNVLVITVFVVAHVQAVPVEVETVAGATNATIANVSNATIATPTPTPSGATNADTETGAAVATTDLETAATDNQQPTYVDAAGNQVTSPEHVAAGTGNNFDPAAASSVYAGLITPEAIQQYVNQFGAAYAPYAAYPAPIGYAPAPPAPAPVYPGPYVVQTGYEGYLVPATADNAPSTTTASTDTTTSAISLLNPFRWLNSLFPTLMMSTLFRVLATVLTAMGMIFFGGAITTAICNLTPICDISFKAVSYLRNDDNAEHVGRMIAEGMTPERVRRTSEFVRKAIHKYRALQKMMDEEKND